MTKARIGFIGVGLMGHGMAKNIVEKGHPLTILGNRNRAPVEDLVRRGAHEVRTAREVAAASDVVFLCVTDSSVVEKVVRGPDGLKAGGAEGLIIADCSTANPVSTLALAAELAEAGITFCDAPLGGTPANAEAGELSAMIGCDAATFAILEPICLTWAKTVRHIGDVGMGHKMKLINNFIAMGYGAIYAEALALGQKVGITPQIFDSVLRGSRMDCGFYQTFFRYVLDGDRNAHQFTLSNAAKDMRYLAALADDGRIANPVGAAVKNSYAAAVAGGKGEDYVPMLADFIAQANGTKVR
ncbi:MAG: NAD(P)-dependent oxidoreductase [Hyphomicrobiales bacterium]|nr:NAD(P)-dependent oxidoreductase [Hyphomicrobiales bacterium]